VAQWQPLVWMIVGAETIKNNNRGKRGDVRTGLIASRLHSGGEWLDGRLELFRLVDVIRIRHRRNNWSSSLAAEVNYGRFLHHHHNHNHNHTIIITATIDAH
jgi:hypothetical protein